MGEMNIVKGIRKLIVVRYLWALNWRSLLKMY